MAVLGEDAGAHVCNDRMPGFQRFDDLGAVLADPLSGDAAQPADGADRLMAETVSVVMAIVIGPLEQRVALDQSAYRARHDALCDRYESLKARCAELKETISDKQTRLAAIDDFLRTLMKQEALPTAFDPMTYHILVERMTVYGKDKVMVRFKNGMEIQA